MRLGSVSDLNPALDREGWLAVQPEGASSRPLDDNENHSKEILEQHNRAKARALAGDGFARVILPDARQKAAHCPACARLSYSVLLWT